MVLNGAGRGVEEGRKSGFFDKRIGKLKSVEDTLNQCSSEEKRIFGVMDKK